MLFLYNQTDRQTWHNCAHFHKLIQHILRDNCPVGCAFSFYKTKEEII